MFAADGIELIYDACDIQRTNQNQCVPDLSLVNLTILRIF